MKRFLELLTIMGLFPLTLLPIHLASHISLRFNSRSCTAENVGRLVTPAKKLEDTIRLAELVIEVLQQNEEHHAEVSSRALAWLWTGSCWFWLALFISLW